MTVEELYEAFMNTGKWGVGGEFGEKSFSDDIYDFLDYRMGKDWTREEWTKEYGMYLPVYDPSDVGLAERERDIDFEKALDTLDITQKATDRVYKTELDTLSTGLGREMQKGRAVSGGLGLRSGSLEAAVEDTISQAGSKTKDLGDRVMISEEEMLDKYNIAMVDTALDFDKTVRQEKEEFYDRTMSSLIKMEEEGAFEDFCPDIDAPVKCPDGTCASSANACPGYVDVCGTPHGTAQSITECPGYTTSEAKESACESACSNNPGIGQGGKTCYDVCMEGDVTTGSDGYIDLDFNSNVWQDENYDYIQLNENCRDDEGAWICSGRDPNISTIHDISWGEDDYGLGCMGCSMQSVNTAAPGALFPTWVQQCGNSSGACDPGCCPG